MRLNETEIENIKKLAHLHLGEDVQVILFGSRASDEKRGGDIDIFIRKRNGEKLDFRSKINNFNSMKAQQYNKTYSIPFYF